MARYYYKDGEISTHTNQPETPSGAGMSVTARLEVPVKLLDGFAVHEGGKPTSVMVQVGGVQAVATVIEWTETSRKVEVFGMVCVLEGT